MSDSLEKKPDTAQAPLEEASQSGQAQDLHPDATPDQAPQTHADPSQPTQSESSANQNQTPDDAVPTLARSDDALETAGQDAKESEAAEVPAPYPAEGEKEPPKKRRGVVLDSLFRGLAGIGPFGLLILLCCMAWPIFIYSGNATYCPTEIKYLTAFIHAIFSQSWLTPIGLDGNAWTAAQWPGLGWVIGLAAFIPGTGDLLLPIVAFTCTFFAVFAVWSLALAAGFGSHAAFAGALILLCAPLFAPLPNFLGPATLAAGCTLFALVFFYRGWRASSAWISLPLGFIFTVLAGLSGGFLPFIVPLLASILFLIWQGRPGRAQKADAIFGFILMLIMLGSWFGALMLGENGNAYLDLLMANAWHFAWPLPLKWLLPLAAGLLGLLPWLLMIFGVSWIKILGRAGRTLSDSRHANGSALIWISLALSLCIAPFIPAFHPSAVIIACLGAILLGKAFVRLSEPGNRFFFLLASLCLICAGILILGASFETNQRILFSWLPELPVPDLGQRLLSLPTLPVMGGIALAGGLIGLWFAKTWQAAAGLMYGMLLVIVLCQPARLMLVPELAAMPGTPLVSYTTIEAKVMDRLKPTEPAATMIPEATPELPQALPETSVPALPPADQPAPDALAPQPATPEQPEQGAEMAPASVQPEPTQQPVPTQEENSQSMSEQKAQPAPAEPESEAPKAQQSSAEPEPVPAPIETPPVAAETAPGEAAPAP